ncbi:MAG: hypothetical protein WA874_12490 [Chryseosolibacter sp.]
MKTLATFILLWIFADHTSMVLLPANPPPLFGDTDNPEAKEIFDRALLLLHNFEYPDARELFREAQQSEPTYALAYWGEAMTYNHPVWHNQDQASAREVINRFKDLSKDTPPAPASLDYDLMNSLDLLYGEGTKADRDKAYSDFMSTLFEKYKDSHEVALFYALSLLGLSEGWDTELCNRAAGIAGAILRKDPTHPGALHYFIHAQDHPEYAKLAWDQANEYARAASYSGHALHMPSHIYLALGLWDDVVRSNEVSWRAGVDRKQAKQLDNNALNYHAHWWLQYGYLQQGRFEKAREILNSQLRFTRELSSVVARNHFVIMRGHYVMETNDWENAVATENVKDEDLRLEIRTLDRFLRGAMAYRKGDGRTLEKTIGQIEADIRNAAQRKMMSEGVAQCGALSSPQRAINQATILLEELLGVDAFMTRDHLSARAHFKKAIDLEEVNGHFYGPPEILKPAHEFYGEFLLATGHPEQALSSFEKSLEKAPGRNQSLHGLKVASYLAGNREKETEAIEKLKNNIRHAGAPPSINGFFILP